MNNIFSRSYGSIAPGCVIVGGRNSLKIQALRAIVAESGRVARVTAADQKKRGELARAEFAAKERRKKLDVQFAENTRLQRHS